MSKKPSSKIRLQREDRNATRFLWLRDITQPFSNENLVTCRFTRVTFGLNCSSFLLAGTIHHHMKTLEDHEFAEMLLENTYVDNVILTTESPEDAFMLYSKAMCLFKELQMNLREFHSNSADFNSRIPENDVSSTQIQKCLESRGTRRATNFLQPARIQKSTDVQSAQCQNK